jgi:hypothetical protein
MRVARIVARREDAARRVDLDEVGSGPDDLADALADLLGPVDDATGPPGVQRNGRQAAPAGQPVVSVSSGLAQRLHGDQQVGPVHQARTDRLLHAEVGAVGVPDVGDAAVERPPQVGLGQEEEHGERRLQQPDRVKVGQHDVHMRVDQARQHGQARYVDLFVAVQPGPDLVDVLAVEGDVRIGYLPAGRVEHPAAPDEGAHPPDPSASSAVNFSLNDSGLRLTRQD